MASKFITMTSNHGKRWLSRLFTLQHYISLSDSITEEQKAEFSEFLTDFEMAIALSEEVESLVSYLVIHESGDKFAVSAINGREALMKVIDRVQEDFGEKWSPADVRVYAIQDQPFLVNDHTWMIPVKKPVLSNP